MTKGEMVGWHHRLDGHEFEQAPGGGDGQGSPAWCSSVQLSSVAQSCLTLCDAMDCRRPCLSPSPGACSNSCPSSR